MKLGVFTVLFGDRPFEAALDRILAAGLDCVEIGTGNYPGEAHCRAEELLADSAALKIFQHTIASRGLEISALSCHGNPLHPQAEVARAQHETFVRTVKLAQRLEVSRVNLFSGCPGDSDTARFPNWVTCAWPTEYGELLDWQWREKVIPYWQEQAAFAVQHGVRLGFEMHPGFVVYNPATLLRLREACGEAIGANLDPSHLFWQGADIGAVIRKLGPAIYHFHAKDSAVNPYVASVNGVLDVKPLTDEYNRAWIFRTVGHGHDQLYWNNIVSQLRMAGYDSVLSIEHEDSLMSADEGLRKAIQFLQGTLIHEKPGIAYWAQ